MDNEVLKAIRERRSIRRYMSQQIKEDELRAVLEAGTWAPTGHGTQDPIIIAVQDPDTCAVLRKLNAQVLGNPAADPFYGAPTIILVLSKASNPNCVKDGSLVISNIMLAAHSIGLGSCWINRCKEAEEIILNISAETGLTKSYIASAMIKFAAKYTVINNGDSE